MKLRTLVPLTSAAVLAVVCATLIPVRAQTPPPSRGRVVKLRLENVALCDAPNGKDCRPFSRAQFKDTESWPVLGQSPQGYLQVQVGENKYWVRTYAVETDVPFRINADCDAVVAARQPKTASTRGIGEECVPGPKK